VSSCSHLYHFAWLHVTYHKVTLNQSPQEAVGGQAALGAPSVPHLPSQTQAPQFSLGIRRHGHLEVAHYDVAAVEPVDSWSKIFAQYLHNPLACATVPQWWDGSLLSSSLENLRQLGVKQPPVSPNQNVCSHVDRHRTLGIISHSQARDSQVSRFLLDATRVSDDYYRAAL
jgi:hypothetical protein